VSTFLERIYYDYDNYAGLGLPEAILSQRSTTIFIITERHLAHTNPFTLGPRVLRPKEKGGIADSFLVPAAYWNKSAVRSFHYKYHSVNQKILLSCQK